MKAKLSLPERPSALYLLAVLDILVLLLILFALVPVIAQQAGVPLEQLSFSSRLPSVQPDKKVSLYVRSGPQVLYRLDGRPIEFSKLDAELSRMKEEKGIEVLVAVVDEELSFGEGLKIKELGLRVGIKVHIAGRLAVEKAGFRNLKKAPPKAEVVEPERR